MIGNEHIKNKATF